MISKVAMKGHCDNPVLNDAAHGRMKIVDVYLAFVWSQSKKGCKLLSIFYKLVKCHLLCWHKFDVSCIGLTVTNHDFENLLCQYMLLFRRWTHSPYLCQIYRPCVMHLNGNKGRVCKEGFNKFWIWHMYIVCKETVGTGAMNSFRYNPCMNC